MKTKILILLIIFSGSIFAQKAKFDLQLKKKYLVSLMLTADNGTSIIGYKKNLISRKSQDYHIIRLDKNLNKAYEKRVGSPDFVPLTIFSKQHGTDRLLSTNGKYFLMGETLIDEKGNTKPYNFFNRDGSPKTGEITPFFEVFGDEYYAFVGRKKGRKHKKKVYSAGDLYIFSRKHADYAEKTAELEFPALQFENTGNKKDNNTITISGKKGFGNNFYMIAYKKNNDKAYQKKTFYVINFDYNGKAISNTKADVILDKVFFLSSGAARIDFLIDDKNKNYYFYGTYGDKKEKNAYMRAKYKGFFIIKYDVNGNVLWQKQIPINDKSFLKAKAPTFCIIDAELYGDDIKVNIIDPDYTKKNWMFFMDKKTGDVKSKYFYPHSRKRNGASMLRYYGSKDYRKFIFDNESFALKEFNPEFKKYLKSLPQKKLIFKGNNLPSGKTFIQQEDPKSNKYVFMIF